MVYPWQPACTAQQCVHSHRQLSHEVGVPPPGALGGVDVVKLRRDDGVHWGLERATFATSGPGFWNRCANSGDSRVWPLWWCMKPEAAYRGMKEGWCRVLLEMGGRVEEVEVGRCLDLCLRGGNMKIWTLNKNTNCARELKRYKTHDTVSFSVVHGWLLLLL